MIKRTRTTARTGLIATAAIVVALAGAGLAWAQTSGGRGDTPLSYRPLDTACTIYATAGASTPPARLQAGEVRPVPTIADDYSPFGGDSSNCGIDPAWDVRAVDITISAIRPTDRGTLTVWPVDGDRPPASTAQLRFDNPTGARGDAATSVVVPVGADDAGTINVAAEGSRTHIVVVLNGVYTPSPFGQPGGGGGDDTELGRVRFAPTSEGCPDGWWQLAVAETEGQVPPFTTQGCSEVTLRGTSGPSTASWDATIAVLNDAAEQLDGVTWDSSRLDGDYVSVAGFRYSLSCQVVANTSTFDLDDQGVQSNLPMLQVSCRFQVEAGYPLVPGSTYPSTGPDFGPQVLAAVGDALANVRSAPLTFRTVPTLTGSVPPISTTISPTPTTQAPQPDVTVEAFDDGFLDRYGPGVYQLDFNAQPPGYECCGFILIHLDTDGDGESDLSAPGPNGSFSVPFDPPTEIGTTKSLAVWAEWDGQRSETVEGQVELRLTEVRPSFDGFVFAITTDSGFAVPISIDRPPFFDTAPTDLVLNVDADGDGVADHSSVPGTTDVDVPILEQDLESTQTYTIWWTGGGLASPPVTHEVYVFAPQL